MAQSPEEDDLTAPLAGSGPQIEHAVRRPDNCRIVLDNDQRIAGIPQVVKLFDQALDVPGMQADARLIEHEQRIDQRGPQRRRQVDTLHLAAAERPRLPVKREIPETDVHKVPEPRADFCQQRFRGFVERSRQSEGVKKSGTPVNRQQHDIMDVQPAGFADAPEQGVRLQACAAARAAGPVGPVLRKQHPDVHAVGLGFQPVEEALHTVPLAVLPSSLAEEDPITLRIGQLVPRNIRGNTPAASHAHEIVLALAVALRLPRAHSTRRQAESGVRDDQSVVDTDDAAEAATDLARADGRVEGEHVLVRIPVIDVATRTVQPRGEPERLSASPLGIEAEDVNPAPSVLEGGLDSLHDARPAHGCECNAVLDDFQVAAVRHGDARVALPGQQVPHFVFAEVRRDRHGECDEQLVARPAVLPSSPRCAQFLVHTLRRVTPHRTAAIPAVKTGGAREKEFQVVVQLGHGAHGRTRRAHGIGLVDGNRRGNPVDTVGRRFVHAVQELPRIGRKGLDVAPLPLGVDRVEGQRRLARTAHAGHDNHFAEGQLEVDALQVVLPRPLDDNGRLRALLLAFHVGDDG